MPLRWFKRAEAPDLIDDADWAFAIHGLPLVATLPRAAQDRLRALCEQFLREKTISGARGFQVTATVRATIAAQACLPVLSLGLAILFAWGWDRSETPSPSVSPVLAASPLIPVR